jgi:dienelactone hydrolase
MYSGSRPRLAALLVVAASLPGHFAAAATERPPATPAEVWAGYDPRQEPLEVEVKRRWSGRGADWSEFYFTGMTYEGSKVRIYAIYAAHTGGKNLPAVLHVHGGGQTVSPGWLRFWTGRGYAALTFNWGGEWPARTEFARWGKLRQGNHRECGAMAEATQPTVRASSWYLWTRVSRRALTALEQQPEVDPQRLGVFGVSMGGSIVWPLAAMDYRVKAACAIYGAGWTTYPDELRAPDPRAGDPATRLWRAAMEPESYAALVRCSILFLSTTNDHHGKMD